MGDYLDLLLAEIDTAPEPAEPLPLTTVFFGGGTPSLIPPTLLQQLLTALRDKYGIVTEAEISMEADPGEGFCT